ncbi:MAG: Rho termination factor N-terminal domain-containing protein, partial [Planctomycetota bacterium]
MMAKAVKSTGKKRKSVKKKKTEEQAVTEQQEQALDSVEPEAGAEQAEDNQAVVTSQETVPVDTEDEARKAKEAEDESTHDKYERIKKGNLYLTDLQKLTVAELHDMAKNDKITEYSALKKQDLIFRIRQNGLMYGEGVLEVLPDGYGFLRNTDYNYLSSSDDIYVSPSQIRRFGLRTGNIVSGQIRPPKDSEKYFALLRVEAINYEDPDNLAEKIVFSDLTPLHPEDRFILETSGEELNMRIIDLVTP